MQRGMVSTAQTFELSQWQLSFYAGERLRAEVQLLCAGFMGDISTSQLVDGCALLKASFGKSKSPEVLSPFQKFQGVLPAPQSQSDSRSQYFAAVECPDALLLWALNHLPSVGDTAVNKRLHMLGRTAQLLMKRFPYRPDLPYQLLMREPTGSLLKGAPESILLPGKWYSNHYTSLQQQQVAWVQGRYEAMWLSCLRSQVDGRYFPISDHHIRGFSILGEDERCLEIFQDLYNNMPGEFQLGSISNLFFIALGCDPIPRPFIDALALHFEQLAQSSVSDLPASPPLPKSLEVKERPLMVVVSSDLRNHPVGRFWLPIVRQLRSQFRLIHVVGAPRDSDPIRTELRELSDEWWSLEASELSEMARRIRSHAPSLLLDLGGHTADNYPAFLSHRLATVQATYLGFYGPTYARCCDWWIVDHVLDRWIVNSYPGAEKFVGPSRAEPLLRPGPPWVT